MAQRHWAAGAQQPAAKQRQQHPVRRRAAPRHRRLGSYRRQRVWRCQRPWRGGQRRWLAQCKRRRCGEPRQHRQGAAVVAWPRRWLPLSSLHATSSWLHKRRVLFQLASFVMGCHTAEQSQYSNAFCDAFACVCGPPQGGARLLNECPSRTQVYNPMGIPGSNGLLSNA